MASIAENTYPRVAWRDREKQLWNPIHKKTLKNLPEERVRLRIIEYLIETGWSKHRISTEEAIGEIGDTTLRTDIICYNKQFEPRLLVECKAEHIPISEKTAEQLGRYNRKVGAPHLLMTNGVNDYWYSIEKGRGKIISRESSPGFLNTCKLNPQPDFEYWQNRGFTGSKASPNLRKWLVKLLPGTWFPEERSSIRFLDFGQGPSDVNLNHYYRICRMENDRRLAITTLNTAYGGNRMIIILNKEGENRAVMEINLDLLFDEKKGNSALYSEDGIHTFDLHEYWDIRNFSKIEYLAEQANEIFSYYLE